MQRILDLVAAPAWVRDARRGLLAPNRRGDALYSELLTDCQPYEQRPLRVL